MYKKIARVLLYFFSGVCTALPIVYPKLFALGLMSFAYPAASEYSASRTDVKAATASLAHKSSWKIKGLQERERCERRERRGRRGIYAYLRGIVFFEGFGITLFSWLAAMYPLEFTGLGKAAAAAVCAAGWFGISLLQSLLFALIFPAVLYISKKTAINCRPFLYSTVFSCVYVIFEWMSTKTWAGVPWGRLSVGQTGFLPMIQISSVFGGYAVSFILVFFGVSVGVFLAEYMKSKKLSWILPAAAVILLSANLIFGYARIALWKVPDGSREVVAAAVQGNLSSHEKWSDESYERTMREYASLTAEAALDGAVMSVYPETPIVYNIDGVNGDAVLDFYSSVASDTGCVIVTGAFTRNSGGVNENSVVTFDPKFGYSGEKYVKRHLVPFGEYVPLRSLIQFIFPPLSDIAMLEDDLAAGNEPVVLDTKYGKIAPLVCFDSIYETLAIDSVRAGGELITLSTNDSWFSDSPGVYEHNRHAVLRSVECGRYIVRAANTGVSSIITPVGYITDTLPPLESGYIVQNVYMISENTLYTKMGNVFIPACAAALAAICVFSALNRRSEKDIEDSDN